MSRPEQGIPAPSAPSHTGAAGSGRPIPLGYRGEPTLPQYPPLTRWQGVAVVLFVVSFPLLLVLVWWLAASR